MKNSYNITIALSGMFQSAYIAQAYVQQKNLNLNILQNYLMSITIREPKKIMDIYDNDIDNLSYGIQTAYEQLTGVKNEDSLEQGMIITGLYKLAQNLMQNTQSKEELIIKLNKLEWWLAQYDILSPQLIEVLSEIYMDVISPLGTKIKIKLLAHQVSDTSMHQQIRAYLLAGIRAAVLYIQEGGSLLKLTWQRRHITEELKKLI